MVNYIIIKIGREMYKIIKTYIAGSNYDNEDGSCRKEILSELLFDCELLIENYYYEQEKAVKILASDNRCVGNIPKELAEEIFDCNEKGKVKTILYRPEYYKNGSVSHFIKIYVRN